MVMTANFTPTHRQLFRINHILQFVLSVHSLLVLALILALDACPVL
jgi:hypothetical protein